ncbi:hypothetical protein PR202_ga27012 [Eleusine coracana subsp. coracana]|uniref:DUF1618 domain-containing protein n=2 Tax=Eleusine coracana subsp. coracana TaxID=191504 RepID=A0AAV5DFQ6_ELECO|nr:hypothetical protein PR202_ga27012 [Eleusine coracana subsp. coracana]
MVLLDRWCYIADLPNNTTAESTTSTGLPIKVTFRAARPPLISHFCVHCPGLYFRRVGPKIVATDADLVLLCVPTNPYSTIRELDWDYFVYSPRAQWLNRLPNPHPRGLNDSATALISRDDGAWYAVAALGVRPPLYHGRTLISWEFDLHLYRSSDSKGWISKRLSVTEFERDKLIPLPRAVDRLYHETGKTITIGGEHGTVAWVDLWRGIFFCDVLKERPVLQDVPLPVPARGNWDRLLKNPDPIYVRDVTISRNKGLIKYVELEEFFSQEELNASPTPLSYTDWVRNYNNSRKYRVIRNGWKSTAWNMKIPVGGSCEGWHPDCVVSDEDVIKEASNPCLSDLMAMLSTETTLTLKELPVEYPILSMDDDVVYLFSQAKPRHDMDKLAVMLAIDMKKATLQEWAELDVQKRTFFVPNFFASEICRKPKALLLDTVLSCVYDKNI